MKIKIISVLLLSLSLRLSGASISPDKMNVLREIDKENNSFEGVSRLFLLPDYPYKSEIDKVENIQKLRFGMSQAEVENIFGKDFRCQFKILKNNTKYECISWFFVKRTNMYFFIFQNGKLVSIIEPPIGKSRIVEKYHMGRVIRIQESVFTDPITRINDTLNIKSLSLTDFESIIDKRIPAKRSPVEPLLLDTFSKFVKGSSSQMKKDYEINFQLLKKYCPDKISLGNSLDNIKTVMGTPYIVKETKEQKIFIYGENKRLKVNHMMKFSWVAVVFENNKVSCAFSNYYFPKEWKTEADKMEKNTAGK